MGRTRPSSGRVDHRCRGEGRGDTGGAWSRWRVQPVTGVGLGVRGFGVGGQEGQHDEGAERADGGGDGVVGVQAVEEAAVGVAEQVEGAVGG